jgi:hypothetical protein
MGVAAFIFRNRFLLLILCSGLLVRLLLSWQRPGLLSEDADGYLAHAAELASHGEFVGPYTGVKTAFRPPGYVCLLAIPLWLGLSPATSVLGIHCLMTAVCVSATALLSWSAGLSRRLGVLAAACVAFDPLLVRYSLQPMSEVPCAAVLVLGVLIFVRAGDRSFLRPWLSGLVAGLCFAAGSLIRPAVLPAAVLCLGAALTSGIARQCRGIGRARSGGSGGFFTRAGLCSDAGLVATMAGCGLVAGLLPWVWRNASEFGAFIPATTHGGYTLALGNNPDFYRDVIHQPSGSVGNGFPWRGELLEGWQKRALAEAVAGGVSPGDEVALDRWFYKYALTSIRGDWSGFCGACVLRFVRFWAFAGAGTVGLEFWVPCLWYVCLWGALLPRLYRLVVWRVSLLEWMLWLCVAAFCGLHVFYWTDARMRAPVMPLLAVLACSRNGDERSGL